MLYKTCLFFVLSILEPIFAISTFDKIISPEIKNDTFYWAIQKIAQTENIKTILEIGSSSGEGSTEAFVTGINKNPYHPIVFCMEISKSRFAVLQKRYEHLPYVKCYNVSSVPLAAFPQEGEVISFCKNMHINFGRTQRMLTWLRQDIEYVKVSGVPQNGIEIIKKENTIKYFDVVLIDGSEFTGTAELNLVYGARFILLDDINSFKNYANYHRLSNDPMYRANALKFA